jgi:hypothetical protein
MKNAFNHVIPLSVNISVARHCATEPKHVPDDNATKAKTTPERKGKDDHLKTTRSEKNGARK